MIIYNNMIKLQREIGVYIITTIIFNIEVNFVFICFEIYYMIWILK